MNFPNFTLCARPVSLAKLLIVSINTRIETTKGRVVFASASIGVGKIVRLGEQKLVKNKVQLFAICIF